jgi:hypothetical protein
MNGSSELRPPSLLATGLLLTAVRLGLRTAGFGRLLALTRRWTARYGREVVAERAALEPVALRVATAAAFFPGRAECLEQSLTLYLLLRRRGVPVELRLGVQPYPFAAHAWVEHDGVPLNDRAEMLASYVRLPSFAR